MFLTFTVFRLRIYGKFQAITNAISKTQTISVSWPQRILKIKMQKTIKKMTHKARKYQLAVVTQMLKLATNAFGLVAALAWNNVIKELVEVYLKPLIGVDSGFISLIIYALIVTALAVAVTLQLSKIKEGLEEYKKK